MRSRAANVTLMLARAIGCGVLATSCAGTKESRVWLGAQGVAEVYGGRGGNQETIDGSALTGTEFPHTAGRAVDAELRVDVLPFEFMIGEEWSRHGVSTDSHLIGVRGYLPSQMEVGGPFVEGVAKFASDDNGGSSAVDGVELRMGFAAVLSKSVMLELLMRISYFDSSDQEGQPPNVSEGGIGVGLRVGL